MVWKILVGKNATNLNLLPFLDQYHNSIMVQDMMFPQGPPKGIGWDTKLNLYRDIECELVKDTKVVSNIKQLQFFATYRGFNHSVWSTLLARCCHQLNDSQYHSALLSSCSALS